MGERLVVVETRYAAGDGVLLGAGGRWVLVSDPDDAAVLEEVWDLVSVDRPADGPVTDRVVALVERAFGGDPPALAVVDLSAGGAASVSRGLGHVRVVGADRILSLDGGAAPDSAGPTLPLVAGVVGASRAEVRPLANEAAASPTAVAPPATGTGLIDGIPADILAATGPEGPPPPRPRRVEPEHGFEDTGFEDTGFEDTGSLTDTTEPHPASVPRIHDGGHTTIRPAGPQTDARPDDRPDDRPGVETPAEVDDHDGATVHRPEVAPHLRPGPDETVLAVRCPLGHVTSPSVPTCRVCRQRVAPQEPRRVQRPTLGGLRLPTGEVVPLDRGVVLGRKPAPVEGSHDWPHLVHLPSDHTFVSRMHLQIEIDGWQVLARDLGSRGGTMLSMPGREPERMRAGDAYVLEPGASLDLAEVYEVRFEVGPPVGTVGGR